MAYDVDLANRIRELLAGETGLGEQRMFGGLAFLVNGNVAIAASGQGGILVRVAPEDTERFVSSTPAEMAIMSGRPMRGWLRVGPEDLQTKRALAPWVLAGVQRARSLPAKGAARR